MQSAGTEDESDPRRIGLRCLYLPLVALLAVAQPLRANPASEWAAQVGLTFIRATDITAARAAPLHLRDVDDPAEHARERGAHRLGALHPTPLQGSATHRSPRRPPLPANQRTTMLLPSIPMAVPTRSTSSGRDALGTARRSV